MMAEDMNKWGGGAVHCVGCSAHTPTPAFVGRLKCCKLRVGLCQACKPDLEPAGFKSPAHAVTEWAKAHAMHCEQSIQDKAFAAAEKWGPKAKELYQILGTAFFDFNADAEMPDHVSETALILLCRTFCNSTGVSIESFAKNFLEGFEEAQVEPTKVNSDQRMN